MNDIFKNLIKIAAELDKISGDEKSEDAVIVWAAGTPIWAPTEEAGIAEALRQGFDLRDLRVEKRASKSEELDIGEVSAATVPLIRAAVRLMKNCNDIDYAIMSGRPSHVRDVLEDYLSDMKEEVTKISDSLGELESLL